MLTKSYISITGLIAAAALAVAVFLMVVASPAKLGPYGVTGWFLLILVGLVALIAVVAYSLGSKFQPKLSARKQITASSRRGLLIGGLFTTIIALSSLRQLNIRDVILLMIMLCLVEFYAVARS